MRRHQEIAERVGMDVIQPHKDARVTDVVLLV
jgi:hypothetical protein